MFPPIAHPSSPAEHTARRPLAGDEVLATARALQRRRDPAQKQLLLKGKNLALLCESCEGDDASRFTHAASQLGARVSHIRPSLSDLATPAVRRVMAQMLGRLYDGIECQGVPAALVEQIALDASIPAYAGIAARQHPHAELALLLEGDESDESKRVLLVQAALLSTLNR